MFQTLHSFSNKDEDVLRSRFTVVREKFHKNRYDIGCNIWEFNRGWMKRSYKHLPVSSCFLRSTISGPTNFLQIKNHVLFSYWLTKIRFFHQPNHESVPTFLRNMTISSTFFEETKSRASCKVFFRTSRSDAERTLKTSITSSRITFSLAGEDLSSIRRFRTIS